MHYPRSVPHSTGDSPFILTINCLETDPKETPCFRPEASSRCTAHRRSKRDPIQHRRSDRPVDTGGPETYICSYRWPLLHHRCPLPGRSSKGILRVDRCSFSFRRTARPTRTFSMPTERLSWHPATRTICGNPNALLPAGCRRGAGLSFQDIEVNIRSRRLRGHPAPTHAKNPGERNLNLQSELGWSNVIVTTRQRSSAADYILTVLGTSKCAPERPVFDASG